MLSVTLFSLKSMTLLNEQEDKWYLFIQNCSQVCPLPCRKNMITRKRSQRIPENCSNMNIINNITPTTFPTVARLPIGKHLLVCNTRDTQFLDHPWSAMETVLKKQMRPFSSYWIMCYLQMVQVLPMVQLYARATPHICLQACPSLQAAGNLNSWRNI